MIASENSINQHLTPLFSIPLDSSKWQYIACAHTDARTHARDIHIFNCSTTICYLAIYQFLSTLTQRCTNFYDPGDDDDDAAANWKWCVENFSDSHERTHFYFWQSHYTSYMWSDANLDTLTKIYVYAFVSFPDSIFFSPPSLLACLFACLLIVYTIRPLDLLYFSIQFNFRFIFCWFIFLSLFLSACLCFFPRKRWNYDDGGGGNGSSYFLFPFAFLSLIRKRNIFQQEYAYKYILVCLIADLNAQL